MEYTRLSSFLKREVSINTPLDKLFVFIIVGSAAALLFTLYWVGFKHLVFFDTRNVMQFQVSSQSAAANEVKNALAYYLDGNLKKAQNEFEKVLVETPSNPAANVYYGLILADQKKFDDAIKYLEKGIAEKPMVEKLAYIYLGISYYETGHPEKAVKYLKTGIELDPGSPLGYYYLGLSYKDEGAESEAKKALEKALLLSGNAYPEAQKALEKLAK